jgi:CHAT domain-containing protein
LDPSRYRYLHFAAHARVSDRQPKETHVVLSGGNLDLAAIRQLRLRADLVTLSACETALGLRVRGEGVIGLPHAFLAAGARGVLVTLWRIGDESAANFMREFYGELHAGRSAAEALRLVRQKWIREGGASAHPARWAPFVLVGGL